MTARHLTETRRAREFGDGALVFGEFPAVNEADRGGFASVFAGGGEFRGESVRFQRTHDLARHRHALADLKDLAVQH